VAALPASVSGLCIMAVRNFEVFQARPRRFEPLSLTPRLPVGFQWEPAAACSCQCEELPGFKKLRFKFKMFPKTFWASPKHTQPLN
jgi:hypothetical protein